MASILVLGGTGFVGAHVCEQLVRAGWQVTVATRKRQHAQRVQMLPGLTVLEVNVHDAAALARAVQGHQAVVNLIAVLHGNAARFDAVHVQLPRSLAQACSSAGVQQLVHVSALGANSAQPDAAPSLYLRSKSQGEAALQQAAASAPWRLTLLRPSVIFGAEDKFLNMFASLQKLFPLMPLAGADARFQPVWVQDVAQAVVRSLQSGTPTVVEACGPDVFTLRQLVQQAGQWAGVNEGRGRSVIALPQWMGSLQALAMECLPGEPLMSRDNLASMRVDNVATGQVPGLQALGITPAALPPIAQDYLRRHSADYGLLGVRMKRY